VWRGGKNQKLIVVFRESVSEEEWEKIEKHHKYDFRQRNFSSQQQQHHGEGGWKMVKLRKIYEQQQQQQQEEHCRCKFMHIHNERSILFPPAHLPFAPWRGEEEIYIQFLAIFIRFS
jgi:hypothetical protein